MILRALASSTAAVTEGDELGSSTVSFAPTRNPRGLNQSLDLENAPVGRSPNALVVLSSLVPVLIRTGMYSQLAASGETYGSNSLSFDYYQSVVARAMARFGVGIFPSQVAAGYGRQANGRVLLDIEPSVIEGQDWSSRGRLRASGLRIVTSNLPAQVGSRGVSHAESLAASLGLRLEAEAVELDAKGPGAFVTGWQIYERGIFGATAMGSRGVRVEGLVQRVFDCLHEWSKSDSTIDPFLADQLLIPACLATSPTTFKVPALTKRFSTEIWVVKQFIPIRITVKGSENRPAIVEIRPE